MPRLHACNSVAIKLNILLSVLLMTAGVHAQTWNIDNNGDWNSSGNWNPNTGFPNGEAAVAFLTNDITSNSVVTIPAGVGISLGELHVGDASASSGIFNIYTLQSGGIGGTLVFDATAENNALINKASTASTETDIIGVPIILNANLDITNAAADAGLMISGNISELGGARNIAKYGDGLVTLGGTNNYTGSTLVNSGAFRVTGSHIGGGDYVIADISGSHAEFIADSSLLDISGSLLVGDRGMGTFTHNSGTIKVAGGLGLVVGNWNNGDNTYGNGTYIQNGGSVEATVQVMIGWDPGTNGHYILNGGSVTSEKVFFVGVEGKGTLDQSAGTIIAASFASLGRGVGSEGTLNLSGGSFTAGGDFNVGDYGKGVLNMTGGEIATSDRFVLGWHNTSLENVATINGGNAKITVNNPTATAEAMWVGHEGQGTINLHAGTIEVLNRGEMNIGRWAGANGRINQFGGTVSIDGISYVGRSGSARYDISNGQFATGNFLSLAHNLNTTALMTVSGGDITISGNTPSTRDVTSYGTGNLILGRNGTAVINMTGGTINLQVQSSPDGTFNSAVTSALQSALAGEPTTNQLARAKDGNLYLGQMRGTGTLNQSGGIFTVAANVFVGGADFEGNLGGDGNLNISGTAQLKVGVSSPSGGDLILGSPYPDTSAIVKLQGGVLDVSKGSILSGGLASSKSFNFSGGTLKVLRWNTSGIPLIDAAVGSLGHLKQDGSGSLLDVTGTNDTTINSNYQLGTGTATIGNGRLLTAQNVENLNGAGVINVGQGGANATLTVGNGTIDVDSLNLNNGIATGNGGVTIRTKLAGKGTVNGNASLASGASLEPGNSAGILTFSGGLTFAIDTQMVWELGALSTDGAGTNFDIVNVAGNLDLGTSSTLVLDFDLLGVGTKPNEGHAFWSVDHIWKIVDSVSNAGNTNFASVVGAVGPGVWSTLVGTGPDAGDILLHYSAVPEPSAIILGCCGVAGVIGVTVRRRRKVLAA